MNYTRLGVKLRKRAKLYSFGYKKYIFLKTIIIVG